jgi:hypothetical protein
MLFASKYDILNPPLTSSLGQSHHDVSTSSELWTPTGQALYPIKPYAPFVAASRPGKWAPVTEWQKLPPGDVARGISNLGGGGQPCSLVLEVGLQTLADLLQNEGRELRARKLH